MTLQISSPGLYCTINNWNIVTQVRASESCLFDAVPHRLFLSPADIVAKERRHLKEVPYHVILDVERRSLVLASVLMAVSTTILLIGTCLVSCRSDVYPPYEIVPQPDVKNGMFTTSCLQHTKADVNCNDHLFPEPFRET